MKQIIFILMFGAVSLHLYAQKIIENPEYGYSTYPGKITKIEMHDTTTVIHFKLKKLPWGYFHIMKESYIQGHSDDKKLFVKNVTGANFKKNFFPPSGELMYQLYFPPLSRNVKAITFGIDKERGWLVHDIMLQEDENSQLIPKILRGNWLLADGSNRWDYGFHSKYAILDGMVWNFKSVDQKGKKYTITLENKGEVKTLYAQQVKNGLMAFGNSPKSLQDYSLKRVFNPNFKLQNDVAFKTVEFAIDTATYSGMIKGFSEKMQQKTGMVYINNPFKGGQESHLVKINAAGHFKIQLPLTHSQTVYLEMPTGSYDIFLEPKKEVFHFIHNRDSYFMGDNARVNSDLQELKDMRLYLNRQAVNNIGNTSPEDYKILCYKTKEEVLDKMQAYQKNRVISKKALQIKQAEIELEFYNMLLGYDMYRRSIVKKNEEAKSKEDVLPYKEFEVSSSYYNFLPKDILDNRLLTLSNSFYYFINRLVNADIFSDVKLTQPSKVELAKWLQKKGVEFSTNEINMVEFSKQIETPEMLAKLDQFEKTFGDAKQAFYKKYREHFEGTSAYLKKQDHPKHDFILNVVDYLKTKNIAITEDEAKMVEALNVLKTPEEIEEKRMFNAQFGPYVKTFYDKYNEFASEIFRERLNKMQDEKMQAFFGTQNSFVQDVIKMQNLCRKFEEYEFYDNTMLTIAQQTLQTPFLKDYLAFCNTQTKEKIERNKTQGGYTIHDVEKDAGDELFDAMIEKFQGKVVYVDFWATWCAPCKSGIKRIVPLKEEMADEDIVFLYVTNQTSPENTWKNAIANITGEHYRVSDDEWNYLKQKFNISGIPHYTLVDKQGRVVKPKMGHLNNQILKQVLQEELGK